MVKKIFYFVCLLCPLNVTAAENISLYALFESKAIIMVDGTRRMLKHGEESPEGIKLISTDTQEEIAIVEMDGQRQELKLGVVIARFTSPDKSSVTLWADSNGFFHADGSINGSTVTFLVDTGANTVALSSVMARKIGLDYTKGEQGVAKTASGFVRMYGLKLDSVKVGGIILRNVQAGVIDGNQPDTPLLGMSFLGSLEMKRDGNKMELIQKY